MAETVGEINYKNGVALKMFITVAEERKNSVRIHYHSKAELSLVLSGKGIYKIRDKLYPITKGDMFFIRPNEAHCISDIEKGNMSLLTLQVEPFFVYTKFPDCSSSDYSKILSMTHELGSNKLGELIPEKEFGKIKDAYICIKDELLNSRGDFRYMIVSYLTEIFVSISRHSAASGAEKRRYNSEKILSSIEYINKYFEKKLTLAEIAGQAGYEKCYFSTVFKSFMGMTVWDYINIKRIEKASTLVKQTDESILDIALKCGFNNTADFNKIFRKYTNVSPRDMRK